MKFGLGYFPTAEAMPPGELGRLLEERGHESLFFAEHTHIPAARQSPWPAGGELPPKYARTYVVVRQPPRTPGGAAHTSRGVVLGQRNSAAIPPPCVLPPLGAALASRTRWLPDDHGPLRRLHRWRCGGLSIALSPRAAGTRPHRTGSSPHPNFAASGPGRSRRSALTRRSWSAATARR